MKKVLVSFFLALYILMAIGLKMSVHFCHGHMDSISLWSAKTEDGCCSKKRPMKKSHCCSDQTIEAKIKADQSSAHNSAHVPAIAYHYSIVFIQPFCADLTAGGSAAFVSYDSQAPPGDHGPPFFIRDRNLRI